VTAHRSLDGARVVHSLVTIIVPVYNELKTVSAVIDRLLAIELPLDREIIVVDDGSTDGTGDLLDRLDLRDPRVRVIRQPRNQGKGAAVRVGMTNATGSIVAIQDADLELDPEQIATLVTPIMSGAASVVYGSRFFAGAGSLPLGAYYPNWILTTITNVLYGARLTDMETCYKVMRTDVAASLRLESNRFEIEPEITAKLLRKGHTIVEQPIRFQPRSRAQGKKIGWRDAVQAVGTLWKYRFARF